MRRRDGTEAKMDDLAAKPIYSIMTPVKMLVAIGCVFFVACATPQTPTHVGVMPVLGPGSLTIYNPPGFSAGFSEGFSRWSLVDSDIESSHSAADGLILAGVLLSVVTGLVGGLVGGVVEELDTSRPSRGQLAEAQSAARASGARVDLAKILHDEIVKELRRVAAGFPDVPYRFVERVESIDDDFESVFDGRDARVGLLEVKIEQIVISSYWARQPLAPITLTASVRLRSLHSGKVITRELLTGGTNRYSADWRALEWGYTDRFSQSIENALVASAKSLAIVIVQSFWGRPPS
jgi:hypothetical protein